MQQLVRPSDDRGDVAHFADGCPRRDAGQEERLRLVEVADAGEVALLEQRGTDLARRVGGQASYRFGLVPAAVEVRRSEQVGAEMPDDGRLLCGAEQLDDRQPVADGEPALRAQDDSHLPVGAAGPRCPRPEQTPAAVHLEVAVQRQPGVGAGEQMLAAADHLDDGLPGEIRRRELRDPEVAVHEDAAGERLVQPPRHQPDGVSLRHASTLAAPMQDFRPCRCGPWVVHRAISTGRTGGGS